MLIETLAARRKYLSALGCLLIALLAAAPVLAGGRPPACSLRTPEACRTTNDLAWSPGFRTAVARFVGRGAGPYNGTRRADEAVLRALGGAPADRAAAPDGGWLFSACEAHDCPIKGVLLLGRDRRIRAAGLFDFPCSPHDCANEPRLHLFMRDPGDTAARRLLTAWAEHTIAQDLAAFPDNAAKRLAGVEVTQAAER